MLETNKIYCMDCLDGLKLMDSESVDFILTDPPFNVGLDYLDYDDNLSDNDYSIWCEGWINQLYRILKPNKYCVIFTGDLKIYYVMRAIYNTPFIFHHFLKWYKPNCQRALSGTVVFNRVELAFVLSKGIPDIKKINRKVLHEDILTYRCSSLSKKEDLGDIQFNHPAGRPIKLYRHIINGFGGDIVLDPFMGSGTTAIACKQLGKKYIGFEIQKEYCEIANKRLQQEVLPL